MFAAATKYKTVSFYALYDAYVSTLVTATSNNCVFEDIELPSPIRRRNYPYKLQHQRYPKIVITHHRKVREGGMRWR